MTVFLDTNVLLDIFLPGRGFQQAGLRLFALCQQRKLTAFTLDLTITNISYILRKAESESVSQTLNTVLDNVSLVSLTEAHFRLGLSLIFSDREDSFQYAAALQVQGLDAIITRNKKDFQHQLYQYLTIEELLKSWDA